MVVLRAQQVMQVESRVVETGIHLSRLIYNAGSAAARIIRERVGIIDKKITIICGAGNNGADGFVVAQKLHESGADITVIMACGIPKVLDAKEMFDRIKNIGIPVLYLDRNPTEVRLAINQASIIVDAVFGINFRGKIPAYLHELFSLVNKADAFKVALDLPSGVICDNGRADSYAIKANLTVAFSTLKPAHITYPAARHCGRSIVADIGISSDIISSVPSNIQVIDKKMISGVIKPRPPEGHKGDYGRLLCVVGSRGMTGAAILAAKAAVKCGCGIVELAVPKSCFVPLASQLVEPIIFSLEENEQGTLSERCKIELLNRIKYAQGCLIGCGLGNNPDTRSVVMDIVKNSACPLVIDADGINAIAGNINILREAKAPVVLTPHPGEMATLAGITVSQVQSDRIKIASEFAASYNIVVVLKGTNTVIADTSGRVFVNTTGNAGMAKGGSGDMLAGMVGSLLAQGMPPAKAAVCAVHLHGLSGDKAAKRLSQHSMTPSDMLHDLPLVFLEFERG